MRVVLPKPTQKQLMQSASTLQNSTWLMHEGWVSNPDISRYRWRRGKHEIHCRLDFFLVSQSLLCNVTHAHISVGFKAGYSNCNSKESKGIKLLEIKHVLFNQRQNTYIKLGQPSRVSRTNIKTMNQTE